MPDPKRAGSGPAVPVTTPTPPLVCLKVLHLFFHIRLLKFCVKLLIPSTTPQKQELWKFTLHGVENVASHVFVLKHPIESLKGHNSCRRDSFLLPLPGDD